MRDCTLLHVAEAVIVLLIHEVCYAILCSDDDITRV